MLFRTADLLKVILDKSVCQGDCSAFLDIGCGHGELAAELGGKFSRIVGIDIDPVEIARARTLYGARSDLEFRLGDANNLESILAEDEKFDCIVSVFAVHHMSINQVLQSIRDRLHPGGTVLILDIYADNKKSVPFYLFDQFIWSAIRHPTAFIGSLRLLGVTLTLRYMIWRLMYSVSQSGGLHVRADLSLGIPPALAVWVVTLNEAFQGGEIKLIVPSTLVFSWSYR